MTQKNKENQPEQEAASKQDQLNKAHERDEVQIEIGKNISPGILKLINSNRSIKAHWEGRGKTATGPDGKAMDNSRSAYDLTVGGDLVKNGITDRNELATALMNRELGQAQEAGLEYVLETIDKVFECLGVDDEDDGHTLNFHPDEITITNQNPPIIGIRIGSVSMKVDSAEFLDQKKFKTRFLDAFKFVAKLPKINDWEDIQNNWLADATVIELPPDASAEYSLRECVYQAVTNLQEGDDGASLDYENMLVIDGVTVFKTNAVLRAVESALGKTEKVSRNKICDVLRTLGCINKAVWFEVADRKKQIKVWHTPQKWPQDLMWESSQEEN